MSPRPARGERRIDLKEAIKESAWKGIAESGASSLSLRAIARDLGITAPAIYNYFADRDALVTALIIDAYMSFGDWQLAARDRVAGKGLAATFDSIGVAYRAWAVAFPQRYLLIFGTPIPGYQVPHEQVRTAGSRSLSALVETVDQARRSGQLVTHRFPAIHASWAEPFRQWAEQSGTHTLSLSVALLIWARVHGLVSLEISGHLPPFGKNSDGLYLYELRSIGEQFLRLEPAPELPKTSTHR